MAGGLPPNCGAEERHIIVGGTARDCLFGTICKRIYSVFSSVPEICDPDVWLGWVGSVIWDGRLIDYFLGMSLKKMLLNKQTFV